MSSATMNSVIRLSSIVALLAAVVSAMAFGQAPSAGTEAIVAAQERVAREYADSELSPFTAVASRYFLSAETTRLVSSPEGFAFVTSTAASGIVDVAFDGREIVVTPVAGAGPLAIRGRSRKEESGGDRPLTGTTRVTDADLLVFGRYILETGARPGTGRAVVYDPQAPSRKAFHGLHWFPATTAMQRPATFTPIATPDAIVVGTSRGLQKEFYRVGVFAFEVDGTPVKLVGLATSAVPKPGEELFIPFRDATTGRESYGVGRYLNVTFRGADAKYVLDFNLATNPYCAYSPHYNCVIPPKENTLPVAIRAGEMKYSDDHR